METKKKVPVSFKIDKQDKEEASRIFNDLGLNLSTAFTMFVKKSIVEGGLPFDARDPFYSKANQTELKKRAQDISNNKKENHELIDND